MAELSREVQTRQTQQDRRTNNRDGLLPDRRDTDAGRRRAYVDIVSVGDGGKADAVRQALGLFEKNVNDGAKKIHEAQEERYGAQGLLDAQAGHEDPEAMRRSLAYRTAITTQRAQDEFFKNREVLDDVLKEAMQKQTSADPDVRVAELLKLVDDNRMGLLIDPETKKLRDFGSPGAAKWLAESLQKDRAAIRAGLHEKVEQVMNEESVNNGVGLWRKQLLSGDPVDFEAQFKTILPTVDRKAYKKALVAEGMNVAQELTDQALALEENPNATAADLASAQALRIRAIHIGEALANSRVQVEAREGAAVPTAPAVSPDAPAPTIDSMWAAIIKNEGGTDKNGRFLTSPKGAIGPAQVMPGTAPEAAALAGLPWDPVKYRTDAAYNIAIGKAYFQKQLNDFGDPAKAAAAYNGGPNRVRRLVAAHGDNWRNHLPGETKQYVTDFLKQVGPGGGVTFGPGANLAAVEPTPTGVLAAQSADTSNILNGPQGVYSLSAEERGQVQEFTRRLRTQASNATATVLKKQQDDTYYELMLGTAGMGGYPNLTEAAQMVREGKLRPEHFVSLKNTVDADTRAAEAAAERASGSTTENRLAQVDSHADPLIADYLSGKKSPTRAKQELARIAGTITDREVRAAVIREVTQAIDTDIKLKLEDPQYRGAVRTLDEWEGTYAASLGRASLPRGMSIEQAQGIVKGLVDQARRAVLGSGLPPEKLPEMMKRTEETLDRAIRTRFPPRQARTAPRASGV